MSLLSTPLPEALLCVPVGCQEWQHFQGEAPDHEMVSP